MTKKSISFAIAHAVQARELGNKTIRGTVIVGRFCSCLSLPPRRFIRLTL